MRRYADLHGSEHLRRFSGLSVADHARISDLRGNRILRGNDHLPRHGKLRRHCFVPSIEHLRRTAYLSRHNYLRRHTDLPGLDHLLRPADLQGSADMHSFPDMQHAADLRQSVDLLQ